MSSQTIDEVRSALDAFHARAAGSRAVEKLIARWDRLVEVRVLSERARSFFLRSAGGRMLPPAIASPAEADVVVAADATTLARIFRGEVNPARAHLDGDLQVFGSQRDQLVLDSIVLLIWGF
jgi:hypothetical protein